MRQYFSLRANIIENDLITFFKRRIKRAVVVYQRAKQVKLTKYSTTFWVLLKTALLIVKLAYVSSVMYNPQSHDHRYDNNRLTFDSLVTPLWGGMPFRCKQPYFHIFVYLILYLAMSLWGIYLQNAFLFSTKSWVTTIYQVVVFAKWWLREGGILSNLIHVCSICRWRSIDFGNHHGFWATFGMVGISWLASRFSVWSSLAK